MANIANADFFAGRSFADSPRRRPGRACRAIRGSPDENGSSSSQIKLRTAKHKVFELLDGVFSQPRRLAHAQVQIDMQ
jgi:hypothetical protein